jgi:di/tricarboxylate transporter
MMMRMMHESRLWVVHLMIKVLRIRLLEVLVVHLRHRVEETVVIVVVVVLLLLLINRPARRRRLRRRRRRMEAQLLHIFVFFLCGVSPEKTKRRLKCKGRETRGIYNVIILFLVVLPFFQNHVLKSGRKK